MNEQSRNCAHDGCACAVDARSSRGSSQADGQYCSEGCASGSGCDHEDCACARQTATSRSESMSER
jgi:hypothetical protein